MSASLPFDTAGRRKALDDARRLKATARARSWRARGRAHLEARLRAACEELAQAERELANIGQPPPDGVEPSTRERWFAAALGLSTGVALAVPFEVYGAQAFAFALGAGAAVPAILAFEELVRRTSSTPNGLEPSPPRLWAAWLAAVGCAALCGGLGYLSAARTGANGPALVATAALGPLVACILVIMRYRTLASRRHALRRHEATHRSLTERVRALEALVDRLRGPEGRAIVAAADSVAAELEAAGDATDADPHDSSLPRVVA